MDIVKMKNYKTEGGFKWEYILIDVPDYGEE